MARLLEQNDVKQVGTVLQGLVTNRSIQPT